MSAIKQKRNTQLALVFLIYRIPPINLDLVRAVSVCRVAIRDDRRQELNSVKETKITKERNDQKLSRHLEIDRK